MPDLILSGAVFFGASGQYRRVFKNFDFEHADIYNKTYNPDGKFTASTFVFPYPDKTFDFVLLSSVFTHMLQDDIEHYVSEIRRVMKPGGKCLSTWFLLNEQSEKAIKERKTLLPFDHKFGDCLVSEVKIPEVAIAYQENYVRSLHFSNGMTHETTIYGCGAVERTLTPHKIFAFTD